jgi:hypothetical protein
MDTPHRLPNRFLRHPRSGRWPWIAWASAWSLTAIGAALYLLTASVPLGPRWGPRGLMGVGAVMFAPMGAVVASRRPQNRIGWIYCAIGLLCAAQFFAEEYAVFALFGRPGRLPAGELMAWFQNWIWVATVGLYLIFVPLLLPEGHLPSRRWRPVAGFGIVATALMTFAMAIQPGRMDNFYRVVNPFGGWLAPELGRLFGNIAYGMLSLAFLAAAISLVWRARHARALERQQLKWLAFAFAVGVAGLVTGTLIPVLAAPLLLGAIVAMHATTGLAILRYGLYDLDIVVNRTIVDGLVTAALAGIYFGFVVVLQGVAIALTGQQRSELVSVLSTLAIASLFNPVRRRIQSLIDRRFFRRKYDAGQALARFGQAVRGDGSGDLSQINADLIQVVDETLEPASISLWVRPAR